MPLIYAYIKKTENKVVYVGQTINLKNRRYNHEIVDPTHKNLREYNYPLSRGIRKYGLEEYECIILEDNIPEEKIDEREIFWIDYYDTYKNPEGYNLTPGGKSGPRYTKFNEDTILLAKKLIKDQIPFSEISERTGISIVHLSQINTGKRHYDEKEKYPLSNMTRGRKISEEEVNLIISLLKEQKLTIQEISNITNISENIITSINIGKSHKKEKEVYPLRNRVVSGKRKTPTEEELQLLINDLINSSISFPILAKKYGVGTTTIYNINKGKTRKNEELNYPLRK